MEDITRGRFFLLEGQAVTVNLMSSDVQYGREFGGIVTDVDARGIIVTRAEGEVVFIPWTAISTVTKVVEEQ